MPEKISDTNPIFTASMAQGVIVGCGMQVIF